jgi:hypothetical protein
MASLSNMYQNQLMPQGNSMGLQDMMNLQFKMGLQQQALQREDTQRGEQRSDMQALRSVGMITQRLKSYEDNPIKYNATYNLYKELPGVQQAFSKAGIPYESLSPVEVDKGAEEAQTIEKAATAGKAQGAMKRELTLSEMKALIENPELYKKYQALRGEGEGFYQGRAEAVAMNTPADTGLEQMAGTASSGNPPNIMDVLGTEPATEPAAMPASLGGLTLGEKKQQLAIDKIAKTEQIQAQVKQMMEPVGWWENGELKEGIGKDVMGKPIQVLNKDQVKEQRERAEKFNAGYIQIAGALSKDPTMIERAMKEALGDNSSEFNRAYGSDPNTFFQNLLVNYKYGDSRMMARKQGEADIAKALVGDELAYGNVYNKDGSVKNEALRIKRERYLDALRFSSANSTKVPELDSYGRPLRNLDGTPRMETINVPSPYLPFVIFADENPKFKEELNKETKGKKSRF